MNRLAPALALATILAFPIVLAVTFPTVAANAASGQEATGEPEGQGIFVGQRCNMCHSVDSHGIEATTKSESMRAADLSKVGARHDAEFLASYLKKEEKLDGEAHRANWRGSDQELEALVAWLASLR